MSTEQRQDARPLILVVEDNVEMNRFVAESLSAKYDVISAYDGQEGLERALLSRPDLIVTDLMMPRVSGVEMVAEVRKHGELADTPILLLTAEADEELKVKLLENGAQDFVAKPFSEKDLQVRVRNLVSHRASQGLLKAQAEALRIANRSKDEFLAMLAHELRNPIAPMSNAVEFLQTTTTGEEDRAQAFHIIRRQIGNMSRLLDDLLDVSRINEGKIELRKETVSLQSILRTAESVTRSLCVVQHQTLTVSVPPEPIYLDADSTRLEQVFSNLLGNACKYSGEGSRISVSAERSTAIGRSEATVHIRDDGAGIDPELLPRIFELFVQASRTLDRTHGGLGIGLTLVRRLVNLHGGSVEAKSAGLGLGSEFIVRLPIRESATPMVMAPKAAAVGATSRRILIVDDNADSVVSMATLQRRRGHEVRTAGAGPEALAVAAEFLPEVVLLDIGLPGMDGYEVARRLRAKPQHAGTFLIAMTGYASPEDRRQAQEAGFDEHLVKPVDLLTLRRWLADDARFHGAGKP